MNQIVVGAIFLGLISSSCRTSPLEVSGGKSLDLAITSNFAEQVYLHRAPNGTEEACVVAMPVPGGAYDKRDREDQHKLCQWSLYEGNLGENQRLAGVCPKLKNTNPALELYKLNDSVSKTAFEAAECSLPDRSLKKVAKFKTTITCGYTGSALGYFHLSRLLGGILNVEPTVLRTVDFKTYRSRVKDGRRKARGLRIAPSWRVLERALTPGTDTHKEYWPLISTKDGLQVFGALTKTSKGEYEFTSIQTKDMDALREIPIIQSLITPPAHSGDIAGNILDQFQDILLRKDIADMIVVDFLMGQQDRGFNIHGRDYVYYLNSENKVKRKRKKKFLAEQASIGATSSVEIPRLVLKDNDCGIRSGSKIRHRTALFHEITHMSRTTYQRVLWLAEAWNDIAPHLKIVTSMDTANGRYTFESVLAKNVQRAAESLKERCLAGKLWLDLNVDPSRILRYAHDPSTCEEAFSPAAEDQ